MAAVPLLQVWEQLCLIFLYVVRVMHRRELRVTCR
jgi:hypothetical protein